MLNSFITPRTLHLLIPIVLAILTTGFLRLQLLTGLPEWDGGYYTFASQYIYSLLSQGKDITVLPLHLYQLMVAWVPKNPDAHAGWMTAIIYRLKDFK